MMEGLKEGIGTETGIAHGKYEIIIKMVRARLDLKLIMSMTKLNEEEIEEI